ncbi:MAG: hypothetical protein M0R73_02760 [Dehalococcoidia bacterium]|nr:hypothetical protein [Dehalococcoidia bacterium]
MEERSRMERGDYPSTETPPGAEQVPADPPDQRHTTGHTDQSAQPGQAGASSESVRGMGDEAQQQASTMADRAGEAAQDAQHRVSEAVDEASSKAQEMEATGREKAAEGAERAASMLRERSDGGAVGAATDRAAEGMEKTARYLREHDTSDLLGEIEDYVRQHPVQGIAGAVAAGFVVGRILK